MALLSQADKHHVLTYLMRMQWYYVHALGRQMPRVTKLDVTEAIAASDQWCDDNPASVTEYIGYVRTLRKAMIEHLLLPSIVSSADAWMDANGASYLAALDDDASVFKSATVGRNDLRFVVLVAVMRKRAGELPEVA